MKHLSDKLSFVETGTKEQATCMGELQKTLTNETKALAHKVELHDANLKGKAAQIEHVEVALQGHTKAYKGLKETLKAAQKERLAELQVVCNKLEGHEQQILSLPGTLKAQLQASKDGLMKSVQEIGHKWQAAQAEISQQLAKKANFSDVQKLNAALLAKLEDAYGKQQASVEQLLTSIDRAHAGNKENEESLEQHAEWMRSVSSWLEERQEREQGLSHILYRVVEQDYDHLTSLFTEIAK